MATGYTPASPEHTPVVSRKEKSQQPDDPDTEDILTSVRTTKILFLISFLSIKCIQ